MKFSNENASEGIRLSAEQRRPTLKEIREKWERYSSNPSEQSTPINWGVVHVLNGILTYLETMESARPRYVPEPRLGPQPESEEEAIERGKALAEIVRVAQEKMEEAKAESSPNAHPKLCTTSGKPIDEHTREINPITGMQKDYIVLCPDERAKGFVRPVRRSYVHLKCGTVTTMGQALAETYARDPFFYSGTFCCGCGSHFPVGAEGEFAWDGSTEKVGT